MNQLAPGALLLLLTITYALHVLEEGFAGERFYCWIGRVTGRRMLPRTFFAINFVFLILILASIALTPESQRLFLVVVLSTIGLINGLGHALGTWATRTYSPGLITGALLWAPLGLFALRSSSAAGPSNTISAGAGLGAGIMVLVLMIAYVTGGQDPNPGCPDETT